MSKRYSWDSVAKRLGFEAKRLAEKNSTKPTGGNCHIISVSIIVGCDGSPLGLLHPSITKMEPIGESWVIESRILESIEISESQ